MNAAGAEANALVGVPRPVTGLLMASGLGRRMGGDKRLLPWPPPRNFIDAHPSTDPDAIVRALIERSPPAERTVIAAAFDAIAPWCDRMFVAAERTPALEYALANRRYRTVDGVPDGDLGDSLAAALSILLDDCNEDARSGPHMSDPHSGTPDSGRTAAEVASGTLVIHLADHPAVAPPTLAVLLRNHALDPTQAVTPFPSASARTSPTPPPPAQSQATTTEQDLVATQPRRRGGHPIVVPGSMLHEILSHLKHDRADHPATEESRGLRGYWRTHPSARRRVPVDDRGTTIDLDTASEYLDATYPNTH